MIYLACESLVMNQQICQKWHSERLVSFGVDYIMKIHGRITIKYNFINSILWIPNAVIAKIIYMNSQLTADQMILTASNNMLLQQLLHLLIVATITTVDFRKLGSRTNHNAKVDLKFGP